MVLVAGFAFSAWIFARLQKDQAQREEQFLGERIAEAQAMLLARLTTCVDGLRSGASFFAAKGDVSREQWRVFAQSLRLDERGLGVNGIGMIEALAEKDVEAWLARARASGVLEARIGPFPNTTPRPDDPLYVITYLEPQVRNRGTIGRNIGTDPARRQAAEEARDSGEPRFHHRIPGSRDTMRRSGLLLYVPFYRHGAPVDSVEARRAALRGWIYAQVYPDVLLENVLGPMAETLKLHCFDAGTMTEDRRLYASEGPEAPVPQAFERVTALDFAGQRFQLGWQRGARFPASRWPQGAWTAASCVVATLLLAGLVTTLQATGRRANVIAAKRTSELREAQTALATINRLQQAVLDGNNLAIVATDPHGIIQVFSAGAENMLGYRRADMVGRHTPEVLHERQEIEARAAELSRELKTGIAPGFEVFAARARRGEAEEGEWTYVRRDGTRLPVWLRVTALRDGEGRIEAFLGIARDITAERAATSALEESEERFRHAFDYAGIGMALVGLDGRWLRVNAALCEIVGYEADELMHKTFQDITHPDDLAADLGHVGELLAGTRRHYQMEKRYFHRDGHIVWIRLNASLIRDGRGEPVHFVSHIEDITAHKQMERSLAEARDTALQASRMKSEFMANMSHEIRTPMNAVVGMTGLLLETSLTTEQREMARTIEIGAEGLLTVINDVLDFSKIEAGKLRLEPAEFAVKRVVEDTVKLLGTRARAKGLVLSCEIDPAAESTVFGDAGRLRQVFTNLLGNAIKFTERGRVEVSVRALAQTEQEASFKVVVRDTGVGIGEAAQQRLFEPFMQEDSSATRRFGGTGLGLAISRQLVELMGGTIGFTSDVGRGSEFWFELTLPLRRNSEREDRDGEQAIVRRSEQRLHVLLVEDNLANQRVASMILMKMGHAVEIAANGEEALQRLAGGRFDVVLMDCQMPVLDGYETTRRIRSGNTPGIDPKVPIVALTAYAMADDRVKGHEAGMDDYLTKPLRVPELQAALARVGAIPTNGSGVVTANGAHHVLRPAVVELDEEIFDRRALEIVAALPGAAGGSLLPELCATYLRENEDKLAELARMVAERSPGLGDAAHGFAGSAATLGAREVRREALALEKEAHAGNWFGVEARLERLRTANARVRAVLERGGPL